MIEKHCAEVSLFYDPLVAKVSVHGRTRSEAVSRVRRALAELRIAGIASTAPLLRLLVASPEFERNCLRHWWRIRAGNIHKVFHFFRIDHVLGFYRIYSFPWQPKHNAKFLPLTEAYEAAQETINAQHRLMVDAELLEQRAKVAAEKIARRMDEFDDYSETELESIILAALKGEK